MPQGKLVASQILDRKLELWHHGFLAQLQGGVV